MKSLKQFAEELRLCTDARADPTVYSSLDGQSLTIRASLL